MSAEDIKVRALSQVPLPNEDEYAIWFDSENDFKLTSKNHDGTIRIYCFEPCGGGVTFPITTAGDADITSTGGDISFVSDTGAAEVTGAATVLIASFASTATVSGATGVAVTTAATVDITATGGATSGVNVDSANGDVVITAGDDVRVEGTTSTKVRAKTAGGVIEVEADDLITMKSDNGDVFIESTTSFVDLYGSAGASFGSDLTAIIYGTTISIGNNLTSGGVGITPNGDVTIFPDGGDIDLEVPAAKEILLDVTALGSAIRIDGAGADQSSANILALDSSDNIVTRKKYTEAQTAIAGDATGLWVTRNLGIGNAGSIAFILMCANTANVDVMVRSVGDLTRTPVTIDGDGCFVVPALVDAAGDIQINSNDALAMFAVVAFM